MPGDLEPGREERAALAESVLAAVEDWFSRADTMPASGEELGDELAERLMLPPTERGKILPAITDRLRRWESEASRLAAESPLSADPLREIARAAREGERRLHELA